MKRLFISAGILIGLLCTVGLGKGQTTNDKSKKDAKPNASQKVQPKPTAGKDGTLTVTVVKVSGSAEVRESPDKSWRAVKAKDTYKEGAEIRTGYRSKVELRFADNSTMTIKRVSHFRVDKFRRSGTKVVTRSHLSYGKIRAGVEKGPALSDYKITTSLGTLGVNGTRFIDFYVDPGTGRVHVGLSEEGHIGWDYGTGSGVGVDPGGYTDEKGTGQDQTKNREHNVGLVDRFGSTRTEHHVGYRYGNQGNNFLRSTPNKKSILRTTFLQHHYRYN